MSWFERFELLDTFRECLGLHERDCIVVAASCTTWDRGIVFQDGAERLSQIWSNSVALPGAGRLVAGHAQPHRQLGCLAVSLEAFSGALSLALQQVRSFRKLEWTAPRSPSPRALHCGRNFDGDGNSHNKTVAFIVRAAGTETVSKKIGATLLS